MNTIGGGLGDGTIRRGESDAASAQPASPPLALNSAASAEIAGDPQLTGQPAGSRVPGGVRPRRRLLAGVIALAVFTATAGLTSGCGGAPPGNSRNSSQKRCVPASGRCASRQHRSPVRRPHSRNSTAMSMASVAVRKPERAGLGRNHGHKGPYGGQKRYVPHRRRGAAPSASGRCSVTIHQASAA